MLWRGCGEAESARTWKGSSMYGSLTTEAKSACSAASRAAFTAVTISMGDRAGAVMVSFEASVRDTQVHTAL